MKILVSNDDGIDSKGLYELVKALKEIGEVTVVAPRTEQSATRAFITMKMPLRVTEFYKNGEFFGYAVDGTPADCVKMGIETSEIHPRYCGFGNKPWFKYRDKYNLFRNRFSCERSDNNGMCPLLLFR